MRLFGTKGHSESHYSGWCAIYGEEPWAWEPSDPRFRGGSNKPPGVDAGADNLTHLDSMRKREFLESIIGGKFYNQAATGVESAVTALLGRNAAQVRGEITWDQLLGV
jgi:myo-inositol 2-dehydrogenase/D-chiro-inositol 1-dehydrogenase